MEPFADLCDPGGSGSRGLEIAEWGDPNGGDAQARISRAALDLFEHLQQTASSQVESLEEEFSRHAEKWRAETGFMSSIRD